MVANFTAVGAAFLHYGEGKYCPILGCWCTRYDAHFIAFGAAFYTTARVNAARFLALGVGVMLLILQLLVPPFTLRRG